VFVDVLQREIDLLGVGVDIQHLRDDGLALAGVIADVLDPAAGDLADVGQPAAVVGLQIDEDAEVGDLVDLADDEFADFGVVTVVHCCIPLTGPLPCLDGFEDVVLDVGFAAGRRRQRGAADRAVDHGRGFLEDALFVLAVAAFDGDEVACHYSWNLSRPARHPSRMWAVPQSLHR